MAGFDIGGILMVDHLKKKVTFVFVGANDFTVQGKPIKNFILARNANSLSEIFGSVANLSSVLKSSKAVFDLRN
jgi:signal transduction protein with GAF and PtsI domain